MLLWSLEQIKNMKLYFVNYADDNYYQLQYSLNEHAKTSNQFDDIFEYTRQWLINRDFYKQWKTILDQPKGGGYCLWKPYILLDALSKIDDNDIILYMDSADWFTGNVRNHILNNIQNKDMILTDGSFIQSDWTRRDTFVLMDCDEELYHNAVQLEAGIIILKKTNNTIQLLSEWLYYCQNENILTELPNICEDNLEGFIEHRYDQSILTNLKVKYNIYSSSDIRNFCECNINLPTI